jgi:hypothetical protein
MMAFTRIFANGNETGVKSPNTTPNSSLKALLKAILNMPHYKPPPPIVGILIKNDC